MKRDVQTVVVAALHARIGVGRAAAARAPAVGASDDWLPPDGYTVDAAAVTGVLTAFPRELVLAIAGLALLGSIGGGEGFGGTWTGQHANGGRVRAGSRLRVNENGIETFVPDRDGTILSASQTRARAQGGGPAVNIVQTFNVGADVSERTVQLLESMISRNNAKLQRSMRTGGAWAAA